MADLFTYQSGLYSPPTRVDGMTNRWRSNLAQVAYPRLFRIYFDLVTADDWNYLGDLDEVSPMGCLQYLKDYYVWRMRDIPPDDGAYYIPEVKLEPYYAPCVPPFLKIAGTPAVFGGGVYDDPPKENPDDLDYDPRIFGAKLDLQLQWCAYFTRCKMGVVRTNNYWYAPPTYPGEETNQNYRMGYSNVSSLQRVNHYIKNNPDLKQQVESNGDVLAAFHEMDAAVQAFCTATRVPSPPPGESVEGNRFPLPLAAWAGKLPLFIRSDTLNSMRGTLDTTEEVKAFRRGAKHLRYAVGIIVSNFRSSHPV